MTKSTSIKNIGRKKPETWQAKLGTSALNPLQVQDLQDAIKAKKKVAVLQGRKFRIRYFREDREDKLYYAPLDVDEGYGPCGYLVVNRIMEGF